VVRAEPLVLGVALEVSPGRAVVAVVFFFLVEAQPAAHSTNAVTLAPAFFSGLRAAMVVVALASHRVTVASVAAAAAAMTAGAAVVAILAAAAAEALARLVVAAAAAAPMLQQIF